MTIPRYDEIQHPLLCKLANGAVVKKVDLEEPMADHFGLSKAERVEEYASKNGQIFKDRVSWALSYLSLAGLLTRPKRAHYQITARGSQFLNDPDGMRLEVRKQISEREAARREKAAEEDNTPDPVVTMDDVAEVTPVEALSNAAESIRGNVCEDILSTLLSKTPRAFEYIVTRLLQHMGYGGGEATPYIDPFIPRIHRCSDTCLRG